MWLKFDMQMTVTSMSEEKNKIFSNVNFNKLERPENMPAMSH